LTYCLNDVFVPTEPGSADGMIVLEGTPPFKLELSIKDISASQTELRTVEVFSHNWNMNLPSYMFKSIGPHLVSVESVVDSSSCAQATLDPLHSSIWVDVAENAAIIPFDRRIDYCVGEVTQFQLEGIPPWSITSVRIIKQPISTCLTAHSTGIASTTRHTRKKSRPHHSRFSSSSLESLRLRPLRTSKKCARHP
jgi:hypothetical protein